MKNNPLILYIFSISSLIALSLLILSSCVEEYNTTPNLKAEVLIVDGLITNQLKADTIEINYSKAIGADIEISPVIGCKIQVIVDGGLAYDLKEATEGKYYTPKNFRGQTGKGYQLKLTTPNGEVYESTVEKMHKVPPIQQVYDVFDPKAILNVTTSKYRAANNVYLNVQDPASENNNYFWRYRFFEKLEVCKTCEHGYLYPDGLTCFREDPNIFVPNPLPPFYDYFCDGNCWDIIYGKTVNIFSDVNTNGQVIKGQLIAQIPFFSYTNGVVVEIKQYNLSTEGYRFYKLLDLQGQKTGSLTDAPPSAIVGNIRNVNNSNEVVVGFFGASEVSIYNYYVDRSKNTGNAEFYLGREQFPEVGKTDIPFAKCIESRTRTKIKPLGWPK
jgi:Domain of unknown function (DUF4249)